MAIDMAVVPVAGRGTRLLPLTKSQPKEMLPVGQKPVVQYVAEELMLSGIRRLVFITGPGKTAIENHFDINEALTWSLRENGQEELLENAVVRARTGRLLLHAAAAAIGLGPCRAVCSAGRVARTVRRGPGRFHHRPARPIDRSCGG